MARTEAQRTYDNTAFKTIYLKINRNTEADLLAHLEAQENVRAYLKELIRRDMGAGKCCRTCGYFGWNQDSDESCDYWDGCSTEPEGYCYMWISMEK